MAAPADLRFTTTHEWIRLDGDVATIGITDFAQAELGDITYVELPDVGEKLSSAEPFGVIESVKAASDVYAPVDGEIVERNETLSDGPELVNQSPYELAWLVKVRIDDPEQFGRLMDASAYEEFAAAAAH